MRAESALNADFLEKNDRESFLFSQLKNTMHGTPEVVPEYRSVLNKRTTKLPLIVRKALAFKQVMVEMPIEIKREELIVGIAAKSSVGMGGLFPKYATEDEIQNAKERFISPYSIWGHYVPGYPKVLANGLQGIMTEAAHRRKRLHGDNCKDSNNFYQATIICCAGVVALARRYALLARQLTDSEPDSKRRRELSKISKTCAKFPRNVPQSFQEALQSFWLMHICFHSTLNLVPVGRFDQYIYPFLDEELKTKTIDLREAQELIDNLWLKFNERYKEPDNLQDLLNPYAFHLGGLKVEVDKSATSQLWMQNIMLGGQTSEGKDATNALTYLCLNAAQKYELSNPTVSVRFFKNSPKELLLKSCEIIQSGSGQPMIYNDDVLVKAIEKKGIPLDEARDYSNDGCWETLIPGKTEFRYHFVNSALCVDLALNGGVSRKNGKREGAITPDPVTFHRYDQLLEAYKVQLDYQIETLVNLVNRNYGCLSKIAPVPFISSTIEGCLEKGRDITQGGAKYIIHSLFLFGFSHAIDSLAAIKKLVYEDKSISMPNLLDCLKNNYNDNEPLRQLLLTRGPKYGNDDDFADEIGKELLQFYAKRIALHESKFSERPDPIFCRRRDFRVVHDGRKRRERSS